MAYRILKKFYGNSQILAQHDGSYTSPRYFYLHDRLGSVRQIINSSGQVVCRYTYDPFGQLHLTETEDNTSLLNPFKYTGQYFDSETGLYYFRARMYDPYLSRFTAHDPIDGKFQEPLSLHKYLYCTNDPINLVDPSGEFAWLIGGSVSGTAACPYGPAGTFGSATFIGIGDEGIFWGTLIFAAGGLSVGTPGAAITFDFAFSNAERPQDLAGPYWEIGGSIGWGTPVPGVGFLSSGASFAWNDETGIWIVTPFAWGAGAQGPELHVYKGKAAIWEGGYIWER